MDFCSCPVTCKQSVNQLFHQMNHPYRILLALLALTWSGLSLHGQTSAGQMGLEDAIAYALANNPDVKDAQLAVLDADAQIIERRSIGLPQLTGSASFQRYLQVPVQPLPEAFVNLIELLNPGEPVDREASFFLNNNFTTAVNLDAMIFDGSYFVGLEAARAARQYAQIELSSTQRNVRNQVKDSYLPVLLIEANLTQLEKNIANLEQLFFETQETYKAGFAEQLDVDRLELSLANLRTERENLVRQKEIALRALKFTLNYPMNEDLAVADDIETLLAREVAALTGELDYSRRPELQVLEQAIVLNELNVRFNKSGYLPSLRAFGAYQYQYQGNNLSDGFWAPTAFIGINLNVPIFDGLDKKAKVQRSQIALEQMRLQRATLNRGIRLEVDNARDAYDNARDRLADREKNLALAERIYDTTKIKYREGVGSSLEVSQAEQSLYTAQTNRLQALYDLLVAKTNLEEALGIR